jgi:hypothetical protein
VEALPTERTEGLNTAFPPDGDTPSSNSPDMAELRRRLAVLERNQRDMLFLLRSLRLALYNPRVEISDETKRIHRGVIRMEPYNGFCPCCLQTKVVADDGTLIPPVEFDHFLGEVARRQGGPVHAATGHRHHDAGRQSDVPDAGRVRRV